MRIISSAPGKLVLSGEYLVLLGAPALVLAINRRARCVLKPSDVDGLTVLSLLSNESETIDIPESEIDASNGPLHKLLSLMQPLTNVPEQSLLTLDTHVFFEHQEKLGLGSSAALIVALTALFDDLRHTTTPFDSLRRIHNEFQNNQGSGLDVAASLSGGVIRFQKGHFERVRLPSKLSFCYVFTGASTNTADMVQRFSNILDDEHDRGLIQAWNQLAYKVPDSLDNDDTFLQNLRELTDLTYRFDQNSRLGIFGLSHQKARDLALELNLVYKPCGAGGDDIGVAVGTDLSRLKVFADKAQENGMRIQDLEIADDGVRVQRNR